MKDTSDYIEDEWADHKPDLSVYLNDGPGKKAWELLPKPSPKDKDDKDASLKRRENLARTAFAWCLCIIELKYHLRSKPFGPDASTDLESTSASSRVQMVRYVLETFLRQHRECVYSVFITRDEARLMRWDRRGCVMTKAFNYIENPARLLNFLYALACGDRVFQGYDTSINLVTNQEELDELLNARDGKLTWEPNMYEQRFLNEMTSNQQLYPIYKVHDFLRVCKVAIAHWHVMLCS